MERRWGETEDWEAVTGTWGGRNKGNVYLVVSKQQKALLKRRHLPSYQKWVLLVDHLARH